MDSQQQYKEGKFKNLIWNKNIIIPILGVLFLSLGFLGGVAYQQSKKVETLGGQRPLINQDKGQPPVDFSLFWEVWDLVNEKFVDKGSADTQAMVYGAIEGMIGSLDDPFTSFMEPELSQKFQEEINGEFGGVGIEIGMRDKRITVIAPLKDTPAFKAGIEAGDIIIKIDDKDTADISLQGAVSMIRGKKGTKIRLTIFRDNDQKTFEITRDTIKVPTVELEFIGENKSIAYIQIHTFNRLVDNEFKNAAREVLASNADRIVLDLRNNPGGLLDSAIYIASWFLEDKTTVTIEKFGDGKEVIFQTENIGSLKHLPVVILANEGSASASEILAGALRDNRDVKIIGEKTFGKGSVQELFNLSDTKATLKVTIAKWLTPNGTSINKNGIEPTISVDRTTDDIENKRDPQLDRAIEVVNEM